jgi:hypothetical protein
MRSESFPGLVSGARLENSNLYWEKDAGNSERIVGPRHLAEAAAVPRDLRLLEGGDLGEGLRHLICPKIPYNHEYL